MKREFSSGIVIFHSTKKKVEYLLLHYEAGHWDFPKGHIEKGESKQEAALRELKEETGLSATIIEGFEEKFTYFFKIPETKELIFKTVYFFVGKSDTKKITLSFEHIGYQWLPFEQAVEQLTYKNAQVLLRNVHEFVLKYQ